MSRTDEKGALVSRSQPGSLPEVCPCPSNWLLQDEEE